MGTNNTLYHTIEKYIKEEEAIAWKSLYKQIRCNGYIINLTVQAFLFKAKVEQINSYEAKDKDENF